jgi:uncharacterized protein (DUF736 family)
VSPNGKGPAAPIASLQRRVQLFSPPAIARLLAQEKKAVRLAVLRCAPASGAGRSPPGARAAIEAAITRARQQTGETIMATIGTFTKSDNGFAGAVKTLSLNVKAKFIPSDKESDKAPDFRILAGSVEFGAAWKKTAQNGREYLSVRLDDPSFASPIFANLIEGEDATHQLIWSRRSAD